MVEFTVYELKLLVQLQCYGGVLVELLLISSCMLLECRIIFTVLNYKKKNSAGWGKTAPTVLSYREELSTPGRENPRTPASPKACTVTWAGDHCHSPQAGPHRYHRPGHPRRETQRGDFFNLNLKFAPTGSRTQDLRSAAGFP